MFRVILSLLVIVMIFVGWALCSTIEEALKGLPFLQPIACVGTYEKQSANTDPCAHSPILMGLGLTENEQKMIYADLFRNYDEENSMIDGDVFGFSNFNEMEEYTFICCLPISTRRNGSLNYGSLLLDQRSKHIEKRVPELKRSDWDVMEFPAMFPNIVLNSIKS